MIDNLDNISFYTYRLTELLNLGDRESATQLLLQWGSANGINSAIEDIMIPALKDFDKEWSSENDISLGQAYILGKVSEDIIKYAENENNLQSIQFNKGPVIMGNIEDDSHGLGRKLVVTFLRLAKWEVIDLGNDISASEFLDAAEESSASIIGVSAMMLRTAMNIRKVREEIAKRKLSDKIKLAVGGAVFCQRPELVKEVGGDGTSINAIQAPALFDQLITQLNNKEIAR